MIDIRLEQVVSLTDATKLKVLPKRRGGKRVHVATLHRWSIHGHRGVRLETIQVGGTKCTSVEALQRFFNRLSGDTDAESGVTAPSNANQLDADQVNRELDRLGL